MKHRVGGEWLCLGMLLLLLGGSATVNGDNLADKCGKQVQKVTPCLSFATGKAPTPTKECCDATSEMKESEPECLCYIIQQTHNGSPESKSFGIQEAKLLQLPSACNLKNASITNCPKLLGLSPSSPDAAIFTNASSATSTTPTAATSTTPSQAQNDSFGFSLRPHRLSDLTAVASAVLVAFPAGFAFI